MSTKTSHRGRKGSANAPRSKKSSAISLRNIAKFFGIANRNLRFAVAELMDQDEYEIIPAIFFGRSNMFINLFTGQTQRCGHDQNVLPAYVIAEGENFVFSATDVQAHVSIAKKDLIQRFGRAIVV